MNKFILHIIFTLISYYGFSQNLYEHKLDQDKWNDIRDGIRHEGKDQIGEEWTYENQEEYQRAVKNRGEGNGKGNGSGGSGSGSNSDKKYNANTTPQKNTPSSNSTNWNPDLSGLSWIGWLFLVVLGAAIIGVVVYAIMNSQSSGGKNVILNTDDLDNIAPSEIPLTELQKRLTECLEKGDYRGAVRIYYLFILKDLSHKEWIFWEREKTNMHYLREMSGKAEFDEFNKSISYFEVIWYGKRDIDHEQFKVIQPNFTNLLTKLGVE